MKSTYRFLTALAVVALTSACVKYEISEPQQGNTVLTAGISQTKTVLDGLKVLWTNGDKIAVNGTASAAVELAEPSASAAFAFEGELQAPYKAVFPHSIYKDASTVTLPQVQGACNGSFSSQASPMLAYTAEGTDLTFSHPFAVVKVSVNMNGAAGIISYVEFKGNADEQVCGDFTVDYNTLTLAGASSASADKTVRVEVGKVLAEGESCTAFIVVPAVIYASGFTVRVVDGDNNYMDKSTASAKTLVAGQINDMESFDYVPQGTLTPAKTERGVRSTTPTLVWSKALKDIEGIQDVLNVNGVAVSSQYVLLSENGNSNPVYLDALTGEKIGTYDASAVTAVSSEYYATTDDLGRLCFCTYTDAAEEPLSVFVARSFSDTLENVLTRTGDASRRQGYKISVSGDIVKGANVCIPVYASAGGGSKYIANLRVVRSNNKFIGTWQGPNINIKATQGWGQTWGTKCDAMMINTGNYLSSSDVRVLTTAAALRDSGTTAQMTLSSYSDGAWSLTQEKSLEDAGKKFSTALDYVVFNNNEYVVYNYVNSSTNLSYGDAVRLIDLTADSTLATEYRVTGNHIHGAWYSSGKTVANTNCLGDVAFNVSQDGYYLYVYLVFAGGEVACYRYDCFAE